MTGGLPRGRVTVVLGGAGSGKTVFGMQTLVCGARDSTERGILVAFEESADEIAANVAGFGWGWKPSRGGRIAFVDARLSEAIVHGGDFDLAGLLAAVGAKARAMKASRVVFDGLDVLLVLLRDPVLIQRELARLRDWVHASGLTCVVTAKARSTGSEGVDHEMLEFLADCVVWLHHRVSAGTAFRVVRVAKYRGREHSADEIPFSITKAGMAVADDGGALVDYPASSERVPTGVARLDAMLDGGFHRGSSILISGAPGSAKTTLAAAFAEAMCARRERTLFVSFDEAPQQIVRNVATIGIRLGRHLRSGVLRIAALRARSASPEAHVGRIRAIVEEHGARHVVIDPASALAFEGMAEFADEAGLQLIDFCKSRGITILSSSLLASPQPLSEQTPMSISTIADTWIHVSYVSNGGERNRALTVIKSRGTQHSNQVRELTLGRGGVSLADVYTAGGEVLMGTLRWEKENEERIRVEESRRESERRRAEAELALDETRARMAALKHAEVLHQRTLEQLDRQQVREADRLAAERVEMRRRRHADAAAANGSRPGRRAR